MLQGRFTDTYKDNAMVLIEHHSLQFGFDAQQIRVETSENFGVVPTMRLGLGVRSQYQLSGALFPGGIGSGDLDTAQRLLASLAGIISSAPEQRLPSPRGHRRVQSRLRSLDRGQPAVGCLSPDHRRRVSRLPDCAGVHPPGRGRRPSRNLHHERPHRENR